MGIDVEPGWYRNQPIAEVGVPKPKRSDPYVLALVIGGLAGAAAVLLPILIVVARH